MTTPPRLLSATLISPLVIVPTALVAMCLVHAVDLIRIDYLSAEAVAELQEYFAEAVLMSIYGIFLGWAVNLFIGIPVFGFLSFCGLASPVPCALIGATMGLLAGYGALPVPRFYVMTMACGAAVAAVFAAIANRPPKRLEYFPPGHWR